MIINILIIVFLILDLSIYYPFFLFFFKSKKVRKLDSKSMNFIYSLGPLISINAPVRTGKTSLQSGLNHLLTIKIINDLNEVITSYVQYYYMIDFNIFNYNIIELYNNNLSLDDITSKLYEDYIMNLNLMYFDFINIDSSKEILKKYVEAFEVLYIRNNYVFSKTSFYNHITANYNFKLDVNDLKINVAYKNHKFSIEKYSIIDLDELSDEQGASKFYKDVKYEDGSLEFKRKFGHIFEETSYLISTKQDVSDEVKKQRFLNTNNLFILDKVQVVNPYNFIEKKIIRYLNFKVKLFYIFPRRIQFIPRAVKNLIYILTNQDDKIISFNEYLQSIYLYVNYRRNINNKILFIDNFFKSISYNLYFIKDCKSSDDPDKVENIFLLYVPTRYCFGTYDTHYFKNIYDELMENSTAKIREENLFVKEKYFDKESSDNVDNVFKIKF